MVGWGSLNCNFKLLFFIAYGGFMFGCGVTLGVTVGESPPSAFGV